MKRKAVAAWSGNGLEGAGSLTTQSGALDNLPYNFKARFASEDGKAGTNPEELIAAAHAGCYTMQLSFMIVGAGHVAEVLTTEATVEVAPKDGGFEIPGIHLTVKGKVPGMTAAQFDELAHGAKVGCPVSKALAATPITLEVHFEG